MAEARKSLGGVLWGVVAAVVIGAVVRWIAGVVVSTSAAEHSRPSSGAATATTTHP